VKYLFIFIEKIEQSLRKNPSSAILLDMELMILDISYWNMKITKSL